MTIAGSSDNPTYATPVNVAKFGDPETSNVSLVHPDWQPSAASGLRWDGGPIPIPSPCNIEAGSDGHLTIVSPDHKRDWEFWEATSCTPAGIDASVIASYDLTGSGVSATSSANTARGSGTPLISTSLRPDEVQYGVEHTLGVSVAGDVSSTYRYPPASHTDGGQSSTAIKYGDLFVLRSDYPMTGSDQRKNLLAALKVYGVVIIDRASGDFEIEASNIDSPDGSSWASVGINGSSLSDIQPSDWRYVTQP